MFKIDDVSPRTKLVISFTKNFFELLRNSIVVASITYFQNKTGSTFLLVLSIICYVFLGIQTAAYFSNFSFNKDLFANTKQGQSLGLILSIVVSIPFSFIIAIFIGYLVKIVSEAQIH